MALSSKLAFSLLLSLFLLARLSYATDFHYCDKDADYDVKVSGVEINPSHAVRGKPATFNISASAVGGIISHNLLASGGKEKVISGGKLEIDVSYFGWHVHGETHDLCSKTSCPVACGSFVIVHSQVLPGFTPPGSYSLKMRIVDENKKQMSCISFGFSIYFASSVASA